MHKASVADDSVTYAFVVAAKFVSDVEYALSKLTKGRGTGITHYARPRTQASVDLYGETASEKFPASIQVLGDKEALDQLKSMSSNDLRNATRSAMHPFVPHISFLFSFFCFFDFSIFRFFFSFFFFAVGGC
jgi:hypothetical protein